MPYILHGDQKIEQNQKHDSSDSLKQTLLQRARKLKQKMYQETNTFDYSIDNLMNQTLQEINRHKQQFQEKQQLLDFYQESEQAKRKKSLMKSELIQNLQKCKNRYKKHITIIKTKKNRIYTENFTNLSKNHINEEQKCLNVQEMLLTAKDKFKMERREKRNISEVTFLERKNNPKSKEMVRSKNNVQIQHQLSGQYDGTKLYQRLVHANEDLTKNLIDQYAYPQLTEIQVAQTFQHKKTTTPQGCGFMSPTASRKQIFPQSKTQKTVVYSPYKRFPNQNKQSAHNIVVDQSASSRSVFKPVGRIARTQRMALEIGSNDTKVNNHHKFQTKAKRLSTDIVNEFIEGHMNEEINKLLLLKNHEQGNDERQYRILNKNKGKTAQRPQKANTSTQSAVFQTNQLSKLLSSPSQKPVANKMFQNIQGTRIATQHIAIKDCSPKNQQSPPPPSILIKIDDKIKSPTKMAALGYVKDNLRQSQDIGLTLGMRGTVYLRMKQSQMSRITIKNKFNMKLEVGESQSNSKIVRPTKAKSRFLSKSINLDVRGNNLKLLNSINAGGAIMNNIE